MKNKNYIVWVYHQRSQKKKTKEAEVTFNHRV